MQGRADKTTHPVTNSNHVSPPRQTPKLRVVPFHSCLKAERLLLSGLVCFTNYVYVLSFLGMNYVQKHPVSYVECTVSCHTYESTKGEVNSEAIVTILNVSLSFPPFTLPITSLSLTCDLSLMRIGIITGYDLPREGEKEQQRVIHSQDSLSIGNLSTRHRLAEN